MIVKRYVADSVNDAMKRIRSELGRDAIILDSKPIKVGGWFGLFAKKKVEVMAAVETLPSSRTQPQPATGTTVINGAADTSGDPESSVNQQLLQELQEMKQAFVQFSLQQEAHWPPTFRKWVDYLLKQEVHPTLIHQWVNQMQNRLGGEVSWETVQQCGRKVIADWLVSSIAQPIGEGTRIVHFVGPTGVGKTTTIAKIAADYVLNKKIPVGLLTIDTYRIAAVEQLRTYANILDIPIEVVFSPQELGAALQRLGHCSLIFMDTAGRNYFNPMHLSELKPFLQHRLPCETYVVLSAVTKSGDLRTLAEQFSSLPNQKLILTKLDETSTYGNVFNLLHQSPIPLAYLTNGQSVPDDLMVADVEKLTDLLLGGLRDV